MSEDQKKDDVAKATEEKKEEKKADTDADSSKPVDTEEKKEEAKKDVDPKLSKLIDEVEKLTIAEMAELVKAMEERFGVSAAVAAAAGPAAGADGADEKSDYSIMLTAAGDQKIAVIKVVREVTGLGLKEAKDIVDSAPTEVKAGVPKADAEEFKKKFDEAGATVELK